MNQTITQSACRVGARIEVGETADDYDYGTVVARDGDMVTVAWSLAQTETTQPVQSFTRLAIVEAAPT